MKTRQPIVDALTFALELLIWAACIAGPLILLGRRRVILALVAATLSIAVFTASLRWRGGYAMLPGCLGIALLLYNTGVICVAFAVVTRSAGYGSLTQLACAFLGIPAVVILVKLVESVLIGVFGPPHSLVRSPTIDHQYGG